MLNTLRTYQESSLNYRLHADRINEHVCLQLPTGAGKSEIIKHEVDYYRSHGLKTLIVTPNKRLVHNLSKQIPDSAIAYSGVSPDCSKSVLISTYQTASKYIDQFKADRYISDECFVAGTLIDGKSIESYKIGDVVRSFNEVTKQIEFNRVSYVFSKIPSSLLTLKFDNATEITCTYEHPFYTIDGWVTAINLTSNHVLIKYETDQISNLQELLQKFRSSKIVKKWQTFIKSNLQRCLSICYQFKNDVTNKQSLRIRQNEIKQSIIRSGSQKEGIRQIKGNRTQTSYSGWQRQTFNIASISVISSIGRWLADRIYNQSQTVKRCYRQISDSLQNRFSSSIFNDRNRDRWFFAHSNSEKRTRQEERSNFKFVRLESVTIHKQTSDGTFGGMCPDGKVYNLEVENNHTYLANNVIVHNCHHVASATWSKLTSLVNLPHSGYTATPNRLDGQGLYKWFQHLSEAPQIDWFIKQGYLADYELYQAKAPLFEGTTDQLDVQEKIMLPHINTLVDMYQAYCKVDKTIIYATTINHGQLICEALKKTGIKAAFLSSKSTVAEQDFYFKAFQTGLITCLVNVELFTEGVDVPDAQTVILARFCYSTALYLQMVGRVLRKHKNKIAKIIDLVGVTYYHGQPKNSFYWSLEGEGSSRFYATNNQSSQYIYCNECLSTLTHKKYIVEKCVIACVNCQNEVYADPIIVRATGNKSIHKFFTVGELVKIDDVNITALTRILTSKQYRSNTKRIEAIMQLKIDVEIMKKALKYLGLTQKQIDFYFDD